MDHLIYYFTGTGNSLSIVKGIKNRITNTEIREIMDKEKDENIDSNILGIVFPVYCWGVPNIVVNFLKRITISKETYIYCVSCYGGMLAETNIQINSLLKEKNLFLSAGFSIKMPGNFVPMYDIADIKKQNRLFNRQKEKIETIVDTISNYKIAKIEKSLGFVGKYLSSVVYKKSIEQMKYFDKTFIVDDFCTGCGICLKICPKNNILIKSNKPEWQHNCEACLACLHWCPQKAIQSGNKTLMRKRYHNPLITISEMIKR